MSASALALALQLVHVLRGLGVMLSVVLLVALIRQQSRTGAGREVATTMFRAEVTAVSDEGSRTSQRRIAGMSPQSTAVGLALESSGGERMADASTSCRPPAAADIGMNARIEV